MHPKKFNGLWKKKRQIPAPETYVWANRKEKPITHKAVEEAAERSGVHYEEVMHGLYGRAHSHFKQQRNRLRPVHIKKFCEENPAFDFHTILMTSGLWPGVLTRNVARNYLRNHDSRLLPTKEELIMFMKETEPEKVLSPSDVLEDIKKIQDKR